MTRITTRAGRKIRIVAPGHVVDVATGWWVVHWADWCVCLPESTITRPVMSERRSIHRYLDEALGVIDYAEAACALVRMLVQVAAEAESLHHVYEEES